MKHIIALVCCAFTTLTVVAKQPNVAIYYSQYLNSQGNSYIETYFSLDPHSIVLTKNENNSWQGGIEIVLTIEKEGLIIAYDKLQLKSTETLDSNQALPFTIQQSRMNIEQGTYLMKIELADITKPTETQKLEQEIKIDINRKNITSSNILILDSYQKSTKESVVSKWGYDLIPIVPIGTYYVNKNMTTLPFYCEVFNADTAFGAENPFLIRYYLVDNLTNLPLQQYAGFMKAKASSINPVLNTFNIENLASGYYTLNIDVVNSKNEVVKNENIAFYRRNDNADMKSYNLAAANYEQSFVGPIESLDSMTYFVDCLYPISTESERRIEEILLNERSIIKLKAFLYSFWNKRNPGLEAENWALYMKKVEYTNNKFRSTSVPGYRTDMGRVYLQYGEPSLKEISNRDPANYPYEIWQYDQLSSASSPTQTNQNFVFVDQTLTGRNYTLIHSSAMTEIRDHKWRYQLNRTTNRGDNVDATSRQGSRDDFGFRVDNNFIIGDTRYWGER